MNVDLGKAPGADKCTDIEVLFSESNSRFIATVAPEKCAEFEKVMSGTAFARVGEVTSDGVLAISNGGREIAAIPVEELVTSYKATLAEL